MIERGWLSCMALHGNLVNGIEGHNLNGIVLSIGTIEPNKSRTYCFRHARGNTRGEVSHGRD